MVGEGDIIWVDLDPVRGSEQAGQRPALVVSTDAMHMTTRRAVICPITKNTSAWPTKVILPDSMTVKGAVLADQVRSLDRAARGFRKVGAVPEDTLAHVRHIIGELIGLGSR